MAFDKQHGVSVSSCAATHPTAYLIAVYRPSVGPLPQQYLFHCCRVRSPVLAEAQDSLFKAQALEVRDLACTKRALVQVEEHHRCARTDPTTSDWLLEQTFTKLALTWLDQTM